jgi:phenylacetaldehyde dehydrogenase
MARSVQSKVPEAFPAPSEATTEYLKKPKGMLIGKEWVQARDAAVLPVIDPASGEVIAQVPNAHAADVDSAVAAARTALESQEWSRIRPADRERLILRLADLVEANADQLAELECLDNGKSVVLAKRVDVRSAVEFLRYIAGWATKIEGSTIDVSFARPRNGGEYVAYTRKEPVGVIAAIVPWNFPLLMAVWKIGPALAAGCTVVLKPAEQTPLTALRLGELALEAGLPAGVLNVLTGEGPKAGALLVAHAGIDKIAFTGSTEVGKAIGKVAADRLARVSLELGGKSPVIILDDADVDQAAAGASTAIFYNHGQVCTAGSRLYVHRSIFDNVLSGVVDRAQKLKIGSGFDPANHMGPLISDEHLSRVSNLVDGGVAQGARIATGGKRIDRPGYYYSPTVLTDVSSQMDVVQQEVFGPVLVAAPFDDFEDIVRAANDSAFGLAASIWSNDVRKIHRLIPKIKAGTVWVNCHNLIDPALPFGGFKQSGIGREMGRAAVEMYTETKSVCILA